MVKRIENHSKPKPLRSLIGFCGIDCGECKAFVATKNNDAVMKKLVAEEWSKSYGHEIKPEGINCVGCVVVEGPHIGYCAVCEIRTCGVRKKVENCAYCIEYGCGKLEPVHSRSSKAKETLEQIHMQTKKKVGNC
jgi:hypothetical protein